jgi:hypothetical protein
MRKSRVAGLFVGASMLMSLIACGDASRIPGPAEMRPYDGVLAHDDGFPEDTTCYDDGSTICEGGDGGGDGFIETYSDLQVATSLQGISPQGVSYSEENLVCVPGFAVAGVTLAVPLPNPDGGWPIIKHISFAGTWMLEAYHAVPSYGTYIFPSGYFPAVDGSGVEARVSHGHARCYIDPADNKYTIAFHKYFGVNARWPRTQSGSPYYGGGDDGLPTPREGCSYEWSELFLVYENGSEVKIWEGYALYCDDFE